MAAAGARAGVGVSGDDGVAPGGGADRETAYWETILAQAFAGVLMRFGTLGLPTSALRQLAARHFSSATLAATPLDTSWPLALRQRLDEFEDVRDLLLEFRRADCEDALWLASAVAVACLGDNHLWQDLGLPHRQALSHLLRDYFPTLSARNSGDMKWKKFFYKQLCDRTEVLFRVCRAPSCAVCSDYDLCFGAEDEPAAPVC